MTNKKHCIYGLIDPNTKELRYIGRTINLESRMKGHVNLNEISTEAHREWKRELRAMNQKPETVIFESCENKEEAKKSEASWILFAIGRGSNLVNGLKCIKNGHLLTLDINQSTD